MDDQEKKGEKEGVGWPKQYGAIATGGVTSPERRGKGPTSHGCFNGGHGEVDLELANTAGVPVEVGEES